MIKKVRALTERAQATVDSGLFAMHRLHCRAADAVFAQLGALPGLAGPAQRARQLHTAVWGEVYDATRAAAQLAGNVAGMALDLASGGIRL
ncbi:MAG: hypothetical protein HYV63_11245 [Candidatus Schekmanbacteria bacterium]|nr:hypothetical protein [Candidatus Schekmanbacteria bacterium]